ncbi:uncharacterized protein LOC110425471 [Herrania umbratica]|uniref:Uncharacterized protein LOC110425471 n=1 Tax=Herrania umbratica TaxID=108875 RepID=A0A6J1BCF8_9ROSI|nr:uncharacterized protein LOC110425471 [Herrania umbratica]
MARARGRPRRAPSSSSSNYERQWSPLTLATLRNIRERPHQNCHRRKPGSTVTYRDQSDYGYGWLLPGWVAEERRMRTGRLYRYYYDPSGRQYSTKREIQHIWAVCGLMLV